MDCDFSVKSKNSLPNLCNLNGAILPLQGPKLLLDGERTSFFMYKAYIYIHVHVYLQQ